MPDLLTLMRAPFRRFARDEGGTVVAEAVIVLPLFLWAYIALFVYWDAFRSMNTVQKAAFTVSDIISREQTGISPAYVDGIDEVVEYLIDENQDARLRVTQVYWNDDNARFEVDWSDSPTDGMTPQTTTSLQDYAYEIPSMAPGAVAIIVEMEVDYEPNFDIGMTDQTFRQFVVTRPRFPPCLTLAGVTDSCPAVN
jgi:Flp pilus assembly protein TadG